MRIIIVNKDECFKSRIISLDVRGHKCTTIEQHDSNDVMCRFTVTRALILCVYVTANILRAS